MSFKEERLGTAFISCDNLFQAVGPVYEKARSTILVRSLVCRGGLTLT